MTVFIGFGHRSGHGKDTAAKFVSTLLRAKKPGLRVRTMPFAAKLKESCHDLFGWAGVQPAIHYENNREDRHVVLPDLGMTANDLWVEFGEKIRQINKDAWLQYVLNLQSMDVVLCPDTRHLNEVEGILNTGGIVVKVHNPHVENRKPPTIDDVLEDYDNWTWEMSNHAGLDVLMAQCEHLAEHVLEKYNLGS